MSTGWEDATDNAGPVTNGWITSNPTSPQSHGFKAPSSTHRPSPSPAASPKPHVVSAQADKNAIPDSDWANWGTNPATIRSEDEQVVRPIAEYVQLSMKPTLSAGMTRPSQPRPGPAMSAPHPGPTFNTRPPANGHQNTQPHNFMPPRKQPMQPRVHAERPAVTYTSRPVYRPPPAPTTTQPSASRSTIQAPSPSRPPPLVRPDSPSEKSFKYGRAGSVKAASDVDSGHAASSKLPSVTASTSDKSRMPSTVVSAQPNQASGWVVKVPHPPQVADQPMPLTTSGGDEQNGYGSSPEMPSTIVSVKAEDAEVVVRLPRAPEPAIQAEPAGPSASLGVSAPRTVSINLPDDVSLRQLRDLKRYVATLSSEQVQVQIHEPKDDSEDPHSIHWEIREDSHPVRLSCAHVTEKLLPWVREHCNQPHFGTEDPQLQQMMSWAVPSTFDHIVPSQVKVVQPKPPRDLETSQNIQSNPAEQARALGQSNAQNLTKESRSLRTADVRQSTAVDECNIVAQITAAVWHPWVLPYFGRRHNARYEMRIPLQSEHTKGLGGTRNWNFDQIARWLSLKSFFHYRREALFFIEGDEVQSILDGRNFLVTLLHLRNPCFSSTDPRLQWDENEQAMTAQVLLYEQRDRLKHLDMQEATHWLLEKLHPQVDPANRANIAERPTQSLLSLLNTTPKTPQAVQSTGGRQPSEPMPEGFFQKSDLPDHVAEASQNNDISVVPVTQSRKELGSASRQIQAPNVERGGLQEQAFESHQPSKPTSIDAVTWMLPDINRGRMLGSKCEHLRLISDFTGINLSVRDSQISEQAGIRFLCLEVPSRFDKTTPVEEAMCTTIRLCKGLAIVSGALRTLPMRADLPDWLPTNIRSLPISDVAAALAVHAELEAKQPSMRVKDALQKLIALWSSPTTTQAVAPLASLPVWARYPLSYEISTPANSASWIAKGVADVKRLVVHTAVIAKSCGLDAILIDRAEARYGMDKCGILLLASSHANISEHQHQQLKDAVTLLVGICKSAGMHGLIPEPSDIDHTADLTSSLQLSDSQWQCVRKFGHWKGQAYIPGDQLENFISEFRSTGLSTSGGHHSALPKQTSSRDSAAIQTEPGRHRLPTTSPAFATLTMGPPATTNGHDTTSDDIPYTLETLDEYRHSRNWGKWLLEVEDALDDGYLPNGQESTLYQEVDDWSSLPWSTRMASIGSAVWAAWHVKSIWMACKARLAAHPTRPSSPAASLAGTVGPSASQIEGPGSATSSEYHSMKGDKAKGVTSWEEAEAQVVLEQSRAPRVSDWVQRVEPQSPEQFSELEKDGTISLTSEEFFGAHSISQPHPSGPGSEADRSVIVVPLPTSHVVRGRIIGEKQDTLLSISRRTGANVRLAPLVYGESASPRPIWVSGPDKAVFTALQELHQLIKGEVPHFQFPLPLGNLMRELSLQTKSAQLEQIKEQDKTDPNRWTPDLLFFVPPEALAKVMANIHRGKWNTGGASVTLDTRLPGHIRVDAPSIGHADSVCTMVVDCVRNIIPGWIPSEDPPAKVIRDADQNCGFKMPHSAPTTQSHEAARCLTSYNFNPPDPQASGWRPVVKPPGKIRGYSGYSDLGVPEPNFNS